MRHGVRDVPAKRKMFFVGGCNDFATPVIQPRLSGRRITCRMAIRLDDEICNIDTNVFDEDMLDVVW
ncbi:hypothetical protein HUG20_14200 [Salicibibacter cibi]|uniref:Uncharacterized protein n=1 Tax=Salicibibacter cibi TaxID=2743001 RepID=A0A7T7CG91_9BACI|nr:hypothetical protein [Salicibibacter cibi]QQK80930.1 hypothetical protein HUG20_14200 [Salicibibacter cibi]